MTRGRVAVGSALRSSFRGRWLAALLVVASVAAATALLAGGLSAVGVLAVSLAIIVGLTVWLLDDADARLLIRGVTLVFLARAVAASVLHIYLQARNAGGALFDDDFGYVTLGAALARAWHGEDVGAAGIYFTDPSTFNTFVRVVGALFWLIGPDVAAMKIVNTAFAVASAVLVYRTALVTVGAGPARIALSVLLIFPSLALWSSLVLKDSFSLLCLTGVLWTITEYTRGYRLAWLPAVVLFTLPLLDTRPYLYSVLAVAWPIALVVQRLSRGHPGLRVILASSLTAGLMLTLIREGTGVQPTTVGGLEYQRQAMSDGARSAIVEYTQKAAGSPGDCFVVAVPGVSLQSDRTPVSHTVELGATIVYARRQTTDIAPPADSVRVEPGDIVCIAGLVVASPTPQPQPAGSPAVGPTPAPTSPVLPTPTPSPSLLPVVAVSRTGSTRIDTAPEPGAPPVAAEDDAIQRNLAYLPRGLSYVIGAPFPWDVLTPSRWALAAELAVWYPTVAFGLLGLVGVWRRRLFEAALPLMLGVALTGVLSLTEGNLGTLIRHRAMLVPFAVFFAAVGFWDARSTLPRRLRKLLG